MTNTTEAPKFDFPFTLADLRYWVCRKADGTTVKHVITSGNSLPAVRMPGSTGSGGGGTHNQLPAHYQGSLSRWCKHDMPADPLWHDEDGTKISVLDAQGARTAYNSGLADLVIDCGDVLSLMSILGSELVVGDPALVNELWPFTYALKTRAIQISWADRQAPPVIPEFWKALRKEIKGLNVAINCQGGHGRSGTAAVCLMMVMSKYSPLDAITHLRAIHCPRAIESVVQHDYINTVAKMLKRPENAKDAELVKDFRGRFLTLKCEDSAPYRKRLEATKKTKDEVGKDDPAWEVVRAY